MAQHTTTGLLHYSTPRAVPSESPSAPSAAAVTLAIRKAAKDALEAAQAQRSLAAEADRDRTEVADEFSIADGFVTEALARTAEEAEMLEGDPQEVRV